MWISGGYSYELGSYAYDFIKIEIFRNSCAIVFPQIVPERGRNVFMQSEVMCFECEDSECVHKKAMPGFFRETDV